jgi:hypothetical protein
VEAALVDLKRAHLLAPDDETVKASYDELAAKVAKGSEVDEGKLKEAEAKIEAERAAALEKKKKVHPTQPDPYGPPDAWCRSSALLRAVAAGGGRTRRRRSRWRPCSHRAKCRLAPWTRCRTTPR